MRGRLLRRRVVLRSIQMMTLMRNWSLRACWNLSKDIFSKQQQRLWVGTWLIDRALILRITLPTHFFADNIHKLHCYFISLYARSRDISITIIPRKPKAKTPSPTLPIHITPLS